VTFASGWDDLGLSHELLHLQRRAYRARGFGDFWQHMLLAEGAIDLAVDAVGLQPYDLAAVMVIVEEAGGTFTDRNGIRTFEHDTAISSNGLLHHEVAALAER
jgi:histidinol-phosphatase